MSNEFKVPWSGVGAKYTEEEVQTVIDTMKTADPLTQGIHLKNFEDKFNKYIGAERSFAVSSATSALQLAADCLQLTPEDEVIIPAHTYCATAIPYAKTRARIVWADIDKDSRIVTAETLRKCISSKTKAIVVVHLYGLSCDMDPIMDLAKENDLYVVEDCAQSPGASYKGKKVGTIGDFGCFSFHTAKNISTLGEGGVLTVNNSKFIPLIHGLRHNGHCPFDKPQEEYWKPCMSNVGVDIPGFWPNNFCLGEVQCALAAKMIDRLDEMNKQRKIRAKKFIDAFVDFEEVSFQQANHEECENVYHLLVAQYEGDKFNKTQDDLFKLMSEKYKIKVINPYYPLYKYPLFYKNGMGEACCPNTEYYFDRIIAFPFHYWMSDEQLNYMIDSFKASLLTLRGGA